MTEMSSAERLDVRRSPRRALWARVAMVVAVAALAVVGLPGQEREASAAATNCFFWGTGLKGPIRQGSSCVTVDGKGLTVKQVTMSLGGAEVVCNVRYRFIFKDSNGKVYRTDHTPVQKGCRQAALVKQDGLVYNGGRGFTAQEGRLCGQALRDTSSVIGETCVSIVK